MDHVRFPLLPTSSSSTLPPPFHTGTRCRLASLDVFRGLSIVAMIFAIDASSLIPSLGHAPWNGLQFADFIVPAFLYAVGAAIGLRFHPIGSKRRAVFKILTRSLKLFLLGIFLQGGFFHSPDSLSYGVSLTRIRIPGILQRIAVAYLVAALSHVASSSHERPRRGLLGLLSSVLIGWHTAIFVAVAYLALSFLLFVPDWSFAVPEPSLSSAAASASSGLQPVSLLHPTLTLTGSHSASIASVEPHTSSLVRALLSKAANSTVVVSCSTTGDLSPACSAAGYLDRVVFGINHLYTHPSYQHLPECASAFNPATPTAAVPSFSSSHPPGWCRAPFDPEGLLSTLGAIITVFLGLHHGHIFVHMRSHSSRIIHGLVFAAALAASGFALQFPFSLDLRALFNLHHHLPPWLAISYPGMPFNKSLYTISFALFTGGCCSLLLTLIYALVEALGVHFYTSLFEWAGANALLIYTVSATPLLPALLSGVYWNDPANNLVALLHHFVHSLASDRSVAAAVAAGLKAVFWCLVAGWLSWHDVHWRL